MRKCDVDLKFCSQLIYKYYCFELDISVIWIFQNLRYAKELRSAKKSKGETPEEVSAWCILWLLIYFLYLKYIFPFECTLLNFLKHPSSFNSIEMFWFGLWLYKWILSCLVWFFPRWFKTYLYIYFSIITLCFSISLKPFSNCNLKCTL